MSLLDTFDPAEELIKPALQRSFRKDETLPELGIAAFKEETFRMMGTEYPVEQVAVLRAEGCIAVDMECASVMAAGQFRGAEIYQFLYADDCLDGEAWDPRTLGARPDSMHAEYLRLALEIAMRLL